MPSVDTIKEKGSQAKEKGKQVVESVSKTQPVQKAIKTLPSKEEVIEKGKELGAKAKETV